MSMLAPPPPPPTKLARYRQLAPRAAIHVSPLVLGAMSIGDKWAKFGYGEMDKDSSFKLLDAFFAAGGNFIDTANSYQDGSSEEFIGEWMEARGIRDQVVVATKYTNTPFRGNTTINHANYVGNNLKALRLAVDISLKRLRTNYIDVFYVHYWDFHTSVEEIMDGLHNLIQQGTVLYLGISDAPAWFVVKCNEYARANSKTPFVIYQGPYSVMQRDLEREILPMCQHEGLAIAPWNVLAAGRVRSDEEENRRRETGEKGRLSRTGWERSDAEKKVCAVLEQIAPQVGTKYITAVAIAYVLHKAPYMFPIVGGRKIEHLQANIEALSIKLTPEQIAAIDGAVPFDKGFPANVIGEYGKYPFLLTLFAHFDPQPLVGPVQPSGN
ncbi:aryl-alcohol dehydrogenase [Gymnopilus junonius]|uniref:Aryl-alcohol dehydrogenase n=1 Tax=Gymnopilus junonius TaxID=109634 RepID=A0A9P5NS62_GYMJU|nr:aryl-alcohol dehydrogenase [Gymnopilus junonius]